MRFSVETMSGIVNKASEGLKSKALGGVTKESALSSIQDGVSSALKMGEQAVESAKIEAERLKYEAVEFVQKELQEFKGKSAKEMAELTSQKDTVILQTKEKLKKANAPKVFEQRLANDNVLVRKVNKNGAVMEKELSSDKSRTLKAEVTTLAGDYRKTTYNAQTGKPIKTFSNTNGDVLTEYNAEGKAVSTKAVNNKKLKPQKPTVQATEILKETTESADIRKTYSDGSYEMIEYSKYRNCELSSKKFTPDGKLSSGSVTEFYNNKIYKETRVYNTETGKLTNCITENDYGKINRFYNEKGQIISTEETNNGIKRIIKADVNEYGFVNDKNPSMRYFYPKTSKVKTSDIEFTSRFYPDKEVLKMRDGSTAILSKFDGNYNPRSLEIIAKGQKNGSVITDFGEINKWCTENGKVIYENSKKNFANEYYSNVL